MHKHELWHDEPDDDGIPPLKEGDQSSDDEQDGEFIGVCPLCSVLV